MKTQSTSEIELLTKLELAKRLRVSPRKIELDRNMPTIRWGRTVRYSWADVLAYLKKEGAEGFNELPAKLAMNSDKDAEW